jgi:predicted acyltransferase
VQAGAAAAILLGYWALFVAYPAPGPGYDFAKVGVPADWQHLQGFEVHWDKNANAAAAFDRWFLNVFPRAEPFAFNRGGYATLNFVPSLATMIFGLLAGGLLLSSRGAGTKLRALLLAGAAGLVLGLVLDRSGLCPNVKRIWTPTWAVFSAGWACLLLATFYAVIDVAGYRRWSLPLVVVGLNSIAMYLVAHLWPGFIRENLKVHLGRGLFDRVGEAFAPAVEAAVVLLILWLFLYWMYRRRIFLKI